MVDPVGAVAYHERTKHTPRSIREADHRLDFDNQPRPDKQYRDRPQRPLADGIRPSMVPTLASIADPGTPAVADDVDLDVLTQLCYLSVGITTRIQLGDRTRLFRAAACTGALYHIDLYLVTADIETLSAGVYHVDPTTLSLDVLRDGDYRGVLADATGGHPRVVDAPVSVVATSTWWRNAWKYRERTYRHAFWDAGTVLANLLAVAASLDVPAEIVLGFADEPIAELIAVDIGHEAPIAVATVGADHPASDGRPVEPIAPETAPLSATSVEYPLIEQAYRGSMLPDVDAARAWRDRADTVPIGTRAPGDGDRVALEPVGDDRASKAPLSNVIRRRGSCRAYDRDELNFRKVATVLDRATRGIPMDVTSPSTALQTGGSSLRLNDAYCLVNGVDGIEPGVYQYHPDAGALEQLRGGECRRAAGHLALDQRLGADAALGLYFMTDLEAVVDHLGHRGYRAAQLEAAITAGRLYLAAYAHRDLGATGLTFYDDAVTEFLSPRAAGQTPTFLWTLGRPA